MSCNNQQYENQLASYNGVAWAGLMVTFFVVVIRRGMSPHTQWRCFALLALFKWGMAALLVGPLHPTCPQECHNNCTSTNTLYPYLFIIIGGGWFILAWSIRRRILHQEYILQNNPTEIAPNGTGEGVDVDVPPLYDISHLQPLLSSPAQLPPPSYGTASEPVPPPPLEPQERTPSVSPPTYEPFGHDGDNMEHIKKEENSSSTGGDDDSKID
eukprot:m.499625 g.499625  ORF g.499625 m.499625 type:complete len:213 (-) comp21826_c0_seq5:1418-2056(-)